MVHQVSLVQTLEITPSRYQAQRPAVMHQAVVGDEIQRAVGGHPGADPLQRIPTGITQCDQHDRQACEHHGVQVVFLEPSLARLMV